MSQLSLPIEDSPALIDVTFCVVDLETTGSDRASAITEIGAVKVRGGQVLGEFQSLVNPCQHVPAAVAVLTGITNSMVAAAPRIGSVLPAFLEFASGCVLVAHNARFDTGFLKRACEELQYRWPNPPVLDTMLLARTALLRDEVPNCKLGTLAHHFHATTTPDHRALSDARATVDVLHGLIERVGNLGVATLDDLVEMTRKVPAARRAKRHWAKDLPQRPGVYYFVRDHTSGGRPQREYLYVGTSRNLRTRVATYFTASEKRSRMNEMVSVATGVEFTECRTTLEATVLELRLIAGHAPRYNRRSKFPTKQHWLKLTAEPFPRLSLVRKVMPDDAHYFGPFRARQAAEDAMNAIYEACALRRCTTTLSTRTPSPSCAQAELGWCHAPCQLGDAIEAYREVAAAAATILKGDVRPVLAAMRRRLTRLAADQRYEEAAVSHRRLVTFEAASRRLHRVASLAACPQLVAARRVGNDWEIHVVRYGRLASVALARPGDNPISVAQDAVAVAETVLPPPPPQPAATVEETERIADWLESDGVRMIDVSGIWAWPIHAGLRLEHLDEVALAPAG